MAIKYAINNFIGSDTPLYASSEDSLYILENLYNIRPSKPFRTLGIGTESAGVPEWICVDLNLPKSPNFVGIFNHNILLSQSGDLLRLLGCSGGCPGQSGACIWDDVYGSAGPECVIDLSDRLIEETCIFNNSCKKFDCGLPLQYWRVEIIDGGNIDGFIEIGELFLGQLRGFAKARLQPGRADGPVFYEGTKTTYYGQIWSSYFSEAEEFSISIKNMNNPFQVDEMRCFLSEVKQAGGKFVFIPDDAYKFCYYVYMSNQSGFGQQIIKAQCGELYEWKIELRTLVKGVKLLS